MFELAVWTIFPMAMLVAASMDLLTMTIPNKITLALIAGFLLLAPFVGMSWQDFALHLVVGVAMLLVGMGLFAMGWMGGGDAKLFAATGLWIGYSPEVLGYVLLAAVYGGLLTIVIIAFRQLPVLPKFAASWNWLLRLHDQKQGVPYGIALALAGIKVYPLTIWMSHLA